MAFTKRQVTLNYSEPGSVGSNTTLFYSGEAVDLILKGITTATFNGKTATLTIKYGSITQDLGSRGAFLTKTQTLTVADDQATFNLLSVDTINAVPFADYAIEIKVNVAAGDDRVVYQGKIQFLQNLVAGSSQPGYVPTYAGKAGQIFRVNQAETGTELFDIGTTFVTLTGTQTFTGLKTFSTGLRVSNGSNLAPSLAFTDETNTGIYRAGGGIISFGVLGVETFRVRNTNISNFVPLEQTGAITQVGNADAVQLSIRGHSSQNVNIFEVRDPGGNPLIKINKDYVTFTRVSGGAPADASLGNSQMVTWVDETANKLMFRVKYSNGTLKNAEINLT